MSTPKSSLGQLDRLPGEVRNRIYKLAVDSSKEEVHVTDPCRPHIALAFVSKQVHHESIGFIRDEYKEPCKHRRVVFKIPQKWILLTGEDSIAYHNRSSAPHLKPHNLSPNPVMYRFLTAHLGKDVPSAVLVRFKLPTGSRVAYFGESAKRSGDLYCLQQDLIDLEDKLTDGNIVFKKRAWFESGDVDHIIGCIISTLKIKDW